VVKTTEWCPFVIFLARDGSWVTNIFGFLMVRSAKFYQEKHSLPAPAMNNDQSLVVDLAIDHCN
jgi:hypothetical protein